MTEVSSLDQLNLLHRGKVRDVYTIGKDRLLMIASDRLSAFDVVLPDPIPQKGEILTQLSNFWFKKTASIVPNHLCNETLENHLSVELAKQLQHRAIIVKRLKPLPIEAIVRGYIIGSGWNDYQATGKLCGIKLPANLHQADRLTKPLFTPSSKAAQGDHDENINFQSMQKAIGPQLAEQVSTISLALYKLAAEHALSKGIIIADTKFEFGLDNTGQLVLMDEIFTPDSSRFWPVEDYVPGTSPPSFDKQFVRDYLETLDWNKTAPGPSLPTKIIHATKKRYTNAYEILTDQKWSSL